MSPKAAAVLSKPMENFAPDLKGLAKDLESMDDAVFTADVIRVYDFSVACSYSTQSLESLINDFTDVRHLKKVARIFAKTQTPFDDRDLCSLIIRRIADLQKNH